MSDLDLRKEKDPFIKAKINTSFIACYDGAFSNKFCDDTVKLFHHLQNKYGDQFPDENDNPMVNHKFNKVSHRRDNSRFFQQIADEWDEEDREDNMRLCRTFYNTIEEYLQKYLKSIGKELGKLQTDSFKVHHYPPGGHFAVFHHEHSGENERYKSRVLVYMVYLGEDIYNGEGTTEFIYQGIRVEPRKGRLVIFPADFTHTHRGNPTYQQEKYIATGWWLLNSGNGVY